MTITNTEIAALIKEPTTDSKMNAAIAAVRKDGTRFERLLAACVGLEATRQHLWDTTYQLPECGKPTLHGFGFTEQGVAMRLRAAAATARQIAAGTAALADGHPYPKERATSDELAAAEWLLGDKEGRACVRDWLIEALGIGLDLGRDPILRHLSGEDLLRACAIRYLVEAHDDRRTEIFADAGLVEREPA